MSFLKNLSWRYATKKFDGRAVSASDLDSIVEAIHLAPSASGAQPYHVIVASGELKNQLIQSSKQIGKIDASHLFVFCTRTDYPDRAEKQIALVAEIQGTTIEALAGLRTTVDRATLVEPSALRAWAARQTYIALGFALAACAELGVDAAPMEGFSPAEFHSILGLPEYIQPVVIMAVGYRDPADPAQPSMRKKVRFPKEDLFDFRAE
jgi:nitroreductase